VYTILAAIIAIMLGLSGFDIYANARAANATLNVPPAASGPTVPLATPEEGPAGSDIGRILRSFDERPLFAALQSPGPNGPVIAQGLRPLQGKLSLMGVSAIGPNEYEAIINEVDNAQSKLHVLKLGQKMTVGQHDLKLEQISKEEAVLTDGVDHLSVKARGAAAAP